MTDITAHASEGISFQKGETCNPFCLLRPGVGQLANLLRASGRGCDHMADEGSMQGRKRKLPSFMQPRSPAPEPQVKSKKKKSKDAPRQAASPDTEMPKPVQEPELRSRGRQSKHVPVQTGSSDTKTRKQVQKQLIFEKKPVQDRSHAFAEKPEPPKLPALSPSVPASAVRCAWILPRCTFLGPCTDIPVSRQPPRK